MASVPCFPSSSFTFYFLFLFFTAWSMHHSSSVNYSSSCIVAAFSIYAIQVYLSVITCPPKSKEACHFISRKLLTSLHCPLSLEGHWSLHEYCLSSLSRTLGTLWYTLHNMEEFLGCREFHFRKPGVFLSWVPFPTDKVIPMWQASLVMNDVTQTLILSTSVPWTLKLQHIYFLKWSNPVAPSVQALSFTAGITEGS